MLVQYPFYQPRATRERHRKQQKIRSVAGEPVTEVLFDVQKVGLVGGGWKYLAWNDAMELYRLAPRSDERSNLSEEEPEVLQDMQRRLAEALARHPLHLIETKAINPALLESLKALGYAY